jgi:hypothetical protein
VAAENEDNDSYGQTLNDKPELLSEIRNNTATVLKLNKYFQMNPIVSIGIHFTLISTAVIFKIFSDKLVSQINCSLQASLLHF